MAPKLQTALIQSTNGESKPVLSYSTPIPDLTSTNDILVKVTAVALNPTDYKMPQHHPVPGATMGCDFTGTVVATGPSVGNLSPGTRVCGAVHGSNPAYPQNGAFSEFLVADSRLVLRVPDSWSDLDAAALGGIGWGTLGLAFYDSLKLTGRPSSPASVGRDGKKVPVLVYGGATATGTMACQLMKL